MKGGAILSAVASAFAAYGSYKTMSGMMKESSAATEEDMIAARRQQRNGALISGAASLGGAIGLAAAQQWPAAIMMGVSSLTSLYQAFDAWGRESLSLAEKLELNAKQIDKIRNESLESKSEIKSLQDIIKKTNELEKAQYNSAEAYQELIDYRNQIADQFPDLVSGFDAEGNALINTTAAYQQANAEIITYQDNLVKTKQLEQERLLTTATTFSKLLQNQNFGSFTQLVDDQLYTTAFKNVTINGQEYTDDELKQIIQLNIDASQDDLDEEGLSIILDKYRDILEKLQKGLSEEPSTATLEESLTDTSLIEWLNLQQMQYTEVVTISNLGDRKPQEISSSVKEQSLTEWYQHVFQTFPAQVDKIINGFDPTTLKEVVKISKDIPLLYAYNDIIDNEGNFVSSTSPAWWNFINRWQQLLDMEKLIPKETILETNRLGLQSDYFTSFNGKPEEALFLYNHPELFDVYTNLFDKNKLQAYIWESFSNTQSQTSSLPISDDTYNQYSTSNYLTKSQQASNISIAPTYDDDDYNYYY